MSRIDEARARAGGYVRELGVLYDALTEFIGLGDKPTLGHAWELADVLGSLKTEEYRDLLRQALQQMHDQSSYAVREAERELDEELTRLRAGTDGVQLDTLTVEDLHRGRTRDLHFTRSALVLQALIWAIEPSSAQQSGIVA
jgi:hypothetical protein